MDKSDDSSIPIDKLPPRLQASYYLRLAHQKVNESKPDPRLAGNLEQIRHYSITLTDLEKVIAYFDYYILRNQD